jgi:hypothetical protein
MAEKTASSKKLSTSNTKQELLDAYGDLVKQLQEKREAELKPEQRIEEKAARKVVEAADALSVEGVGKEISDLKGNIGRMLAQIADRLEEQVGRYGQIKKAIELKEKELQEIYDIQKSASTLAALIEAQQQKRQQFEAQMAADKEELTQEIETTRTEWERETKLREAADKERDAAEAKRREREKEEFRYAFAREQQLAKDQFADEKAKVERDWEAKKEQMEKDLRQREQAVAQSEQELAQLRAQAAAAPKEQETAVQKAVKEALDRAKAESAGREELLKRDFAGERNVLSTRIAALEQTVKEQNEQLKRLTQQAEKAYAQVQDIAVKAIDGSAGLKSLNSLQQLLAEQSRKPAGEK